MTRRGVSQQRGVDLKSGEFDLFFLLVLLTHRKPHVGIDHVGTLRRLGNLGWQFVHQRRNAAHFFHLPDLLLEIFQVKTLARLQFFGKLFGFGDIDVYLSSKLPWVMAAEPTSPPGTPPGKGVRDLARQLAALQGGQGQDRAGADTPRGQGLAWGRSTGDTSATGLPVCAMMRSTTG